MRLPDFKQHSVFNQLRRQMDAQLVDWSEAGVWNSIDIDEILETTGHDIAPEELSVARDGTLEYEGRKVVVYIRDQLIQYKPYKFHVADCKTLTRMRLDNRYDRYVVTTRTDGTFTVNSIEQERIVEEGVDEKMSVCWNCLIRLDYNGFANCNYHSKNRILESFTLSEFFRKYTSQISIKPTHSDISAPVNVYTANWDNLSRGYRESVGWRCERCRVDLRQRRHFLNVHHMDGNKHNNSRGNLQALCIACHADLPHHHHLKEQPEYTEYIKSLHSL